MYDHREAIESDLINTGYTLDDVGHSLSWDALKSFLTYAKPESALYREISPEMSEWASRIKTNYILADIFDQLSVANAMLRTLVTHKRSKPPEPYKRPGAKNKKSKRMGSKPLGSVAEMREWISKRQVRNNGV